MSINTATLGRPAGVPGYRLDAGGEKKVWLK
jgi:hypothetical protein